MAESKSSSSTAMESLNLTTRLVHAGEPWPRHFGAVSMPIYQSANFVAAGEASYEEVRYIRLNNTPNHSALHAKLAACEQAPAALVTASGMAAISAALLTVLKAGDHILAQNCLYGGTHSFVTQDLPALGITYSFVDGADPASWQAALRPNTKAFYVEAMTNPLLDIADHGAVVALCRQHGLTSLIDNTVASPVNFCPIPLGYDLSLHSATKYMNGHSDLVAGAVLGSAELVKKVRHKLNHLGGSLDPHACFLLQRSLKTMSLRMQAHNRNAQALAEYLQGHPAVTRVNYPGLASHPGHALAKKYFRGFSGLMSFELRGGLSAAKSLIERLRLPVEAASLGGVESLITRPATTSHAGLTPAERASLKISDALVRVSVGIEDAEDLIADFKQALE